VPACGIDHDRDRGRGHLDETARRLSHAELAVARLLAAEGHRVRSLPERPGRARTADLDVCGQPVEVKSWLAPSERQGRALTPKSVVNKLVQAHGQSACAVLFAGGSGLTDLTARAGLTAYASRPDSTRLAEVRVVGDGFDLAMNCRPGIELAAPAPAAALDPVPGRSPPPPVRAPGTGWSLT
jgi:hypothetical protein